MAVLRNCRSASDRQMLLSAHQISGDLAEGTLALIAHPLPPGKVVRRIGLTLRRGWQPTAIQLELLRILRAAAARIGPARS